MRVWGCAAALFLAIPLTGCYTLRDHVEAATYMPEEVRQSQRFVVTAGAIRESNEWSWLPAVAGAALGAAAGGAIAGVHAGSAQLAVDSLSWAVPPQSNIASDSPRSNARNADLAGRMVDVLHKLRPGAMAEKSSSPGGDRIELDPTVEFFTLESTKLYVKCSVSASQYVGGKLVWWRQYQVGGGSLPMADAKRAMEVAEFDQLATICLRDAMLGFSRHASGDLARAYTSGNYVDGTVYYFNESGQRGAFALDSDPNYVFLIAGERLSHGWITVVPLQHIHRFERRETGKPL